MLKKLIEKTNCYCACMPPNPYHRCGVHEVDNDVYCDKDDDDNAGDYDDRE